MAVWELALTLCMEWSCTYFTTVLSCIFCPDCEQVHGKRALHDVITLKLRGTCTAESAAIFGTLSTETGHCTSPSNPVLDHTFLRKCFSRVQAVAKGRCVLLSPAQGLPLLQREGNPPFLRRDLRQVDVHEQQIPVRYELYINPVA